MTAKTKVLISYGRADALAASARLRHELQQAGYDVWRDIEEMRGGKNWKQQLREAIGAVDIVVVLLSPASMASKVVLWECDTAVTLDTPLIGLLLQKCDVPEDLANLHYHDLSTPEKYTIGFANLIRDLDELKKLNKPEQPRSNGTSTGSQFYMPNLKAERSQFGNDNLMINRGAASIDTAKLIQKVKRILQSEHQQLRVFLLAELASMNAEQKQHIEMILNHYQRGQISQQDFNQFMTTMQALVHQLQAGSLSANNQLVQISQQLEQVYSSSISQQHQFEVTIPVIPLILDYKYQFGASMDTDVRNLIERIQELWSQMRNPQSST